jgi:hypothetical protein
MHNGHLRISIHHLLWCSFRSFLSLFSLLWLSHCLCHSRLRGCLGWLREVRRRLVLGVHCWWLRLRMRGVWLRWSCCFRCWRTRCLRRYLRSGWLWGTISGVRRLFDWIIHCFTAIELGVRSECTRRYAQQMLFRFVFSPRVHQHVFSPLWQNAFTPDQSDDLMPVYLRPANVRSRGGPCCWLYDVG